MNDIVIREFESDDLGQIQDLIANNEWPYHRHDGFPENIVKDFPLKKFTESTKTLLVCTGSVLLGYIRIKDFIDGGVPTFDIRLAADARGKGIGTNLVKKATDAVFNELPNTIRFEAETHIGNEAMQRTLKNLGWTQEKHYKNYWQVSRDEYVDALGYAILREDWERYL